MKKIYDNYISLGYFCNIAMDLEQLGFRNTSSPFDWDISNFQGIMKAINNKFYNFMLYDSLIQSVKYREHYYDKNYKIFFYHDFNAYTSLKKQYPKVKEKYDRRIRRFLHNITLPTLFFRYIDSENGSLNELKYIEKNYDKIEKTLKKFNPENKIIFIADNSVNSDKFKIYHVSRDENDVVSRHPILNNPELMEVMNNLSVKNRGENLVRYSEKIKKRNSYFYRKKKKILTFYQQHFCKIYVYDKSHLWKDK